MRLVRLLYHLWGTGGTGKKAVSAELLLVEIELSEKHHPNFGDSCIMMFKCNLNNIAYLKDSCSKYIKNSYFYSQNVYLANIELFRQVKLRLSKENNKIAIGN